MEQENKIKSIAISGQCSTGKSTLGRLLAQKLNWNYVDVGGEYKKIAKKLNLKIENFGSIPEEGKKLLLEIADFTRRIDSYSNVEDAFEEFPQFYVNEQIDPDELFDMAKRQTNQFKNFVRDVCHITTKRSLHV